MKWKIGSKRDLQRINFSNGKLYLLFSFVILRFLQGFFSFFASQLQKINPQNDSLKKNCNVIKCWSMKRNFQLSVQFLSLLHHLQTFFFMSWEIDEDFPPAGWKTEKYHFEKHHQYKLYWIQLEFFSFFRVWYDVKTTNAWSNIIIVSFSLALYPSLHCSTAVFL